MKRVAYFTPLNPQRSGISDYNEELLPYLAEYLDIDLFVGDYWPNNSAITQRFRILNYRKLAERRTHYDVCVYHVGNNPLHVLMYDMMQEFPGVMLLHDGILHHLFLQMAVNLNRRDAYVNELVYAYGAAGLGLAKVFLQNGPRLYDYPMIYGMANQSWGVLVHNDFIKRRLEIAGISTSIHRVPFPFKMPISSPTPKMAHAWRTKYRIAREAILIASFGHIIPGKRIQQSLRAYAEARQTFPGMVYCLVGEVTPEAPVSEWMQAFGLPAESVVITGHVSFDEFQQAIAATDVCINLRYPTTGETSASLIRVLGMGCPTIVSNVGSFAELPDEVCIKIPPNEHEHQLLVQALVNLARTPERRQALGEKAKHHIQSKHDIRDVARIQAELILAARPRAPEPLPAFLPMRPVRYLDANQWPKPRI